MEKEIKSERYNSMNRKRVFTITISGLIAVTLILSFCGILKIGDTIASLVLAATAWVIATQSFATKEMAENQIKPSVDVSMIYKDGGTLFQFLNMNPKVPAYVWITVDITKSNEKVTLNDDHLTGKEKIDIDVKHWATSSNFLKNVTNGLTNSGAGEIRAILKVEVAPMFNEKSRSPFQTKSYRFEVSKGWLRTPFWGVVDPLVVKKKSNEEN